MRAGLQAAAVRGGMVNGGDSVSTGKNGRAVLVRGEEFLVVSSNSRIVIADPAPGKMTQIIMSLGNSLFKIKKMATPHFEVATPYLAAVVKGTTFSVTVTNSGASVQVTEGLVQVSANDGGAVHLVAPGEIGVVNAMTPYRLTVQGATTIAVGAPGGAKAMGDSKTSAAPTSDTVRTAFEGKISEPVGEGTVRLDSLSGGLVSGDSTLVAGVIANSRSAAPTTTSVDNPGIAPVGTTESTVAPSANNVNAGGNSNSNVLGSRDGNLGINAAADGTANVNGNSNGGGNTTTGANVNAGNGNSGSNVNVGNANANNGNNGSSNSNTVTGGNANTNVSGSRDGNLGINANGDVNANVGGNAGSNVGGNGSGNTNAAGNANSHTGRNL